jgi:hypothetical protein
MAIQVPQKFTQIGIFGLKMYHLANPAYVRGISDQFRVTMVRWNAGLVLVICHKIY